MSAADLAYQALQRNAEVSRPTQDKTYTCEFNHFRNYVLDPANKLQGGDNNDQLVTGPNVSAYFTHVVAIKNTMPSNVKRID